MLLRPAPQNGRCMTRPTVGLSAHSGATLYNSRILSPFHVFLMSSRKRYVCDHCQLTLANHAIFGDTWIWCIWTQNHSRAPCARIPHMKWNISGHTARFTLTYVIRYKRKGEARDVKQRGEAYNMVPRIVSDQCVGLGKTKVIAPPVRFPFNDTFVNFS